jgi:hypothetical protein
MRLSEKTFGAGMGVAGMTDEKSSVDSSFTASEVDEASSLLSLSSFEGKLSFDGTTLICFTKI